MDNKLNELHINRIPAARSGDFSQWSLPEVSAGHIVPAASESARRHREREADTVYKSLTASELETITREAYADGRREGLASGHAEGHREGFAQGREEGLAAARAQIEDELGRAASLLQQLLQPLEQQRAELEESLTQLSLELAHAVIGRDPVTEPQQVLAAVTQAVAALPAGAEGIEVYLHPDDAALLEQANLVRQEWRLLQDPHLRPGDCRLRTRHSVVDFTRETRFRQLLAALLEERSQPGGDADHDPL